MNVEGRPCQYWSEVLEVHREENILTRMRSYAVWLSVVTASVQRWTVCLSETGRTMKSSEVEKRTRGIERYSAPRGSDEVSL